MVFLSAGIKNYQEGNWTETGLYLLLSFLVLTPGVYHLFIYLQVLRGVPGYHISMLTDLSN